ncbi:MAG: reverse transcriptase family protein [Gammaproteobacteria bacterium]|nr:reverse transcriptase family protein [Gammaproteobacteria bacterium]
MDEGSVPTEWRFAHFVPVPKKPSPTCVADYRPISKLSIVSKVFEKHFNVLLWSYLQPVLSSVQYGFRSGRSTVDCLANVVHSCSMMLDTHKKAVGVFFYLRAAFDSVDHSLLLQKLHQRYQLPCALLRWLRSYLHERKYAVEVDGAVSATRKALSGVPQGSIIGPSLFIAFIDGLSDLKLSSTSQCFLYADDLLLLKPVRSVQDEVDLQADILAIVTHIESLNLKINSSKTKCIVFGRHSCTPTLSRQLCVAQSVIECVDVFRYLGVFLDCRLSFSYQSDIATSKLKKAVGVLNRNFRKFAPLYVIESVYHVCLLPALLYGIEVWWPSAQVHQLRVERAHRFMIRTFVNNFSRNVSYIQLLDSANDVGNRMWFPISRIVAARRMTLFYKYYYGLRYFPCDFILPVQGRRSRRLQHHDLQIQPPSASSAPTFLHKSVEIWNSLDSNKVHSRCIAFVQYCSSDLFYSHVVDSGFVFLL